MENQYTAHIIHILHCDMRRNNDSTALGCGQLDGRNVQAQTQMQKQTLTELICDGRSPDDLRPRATGVLMPAIRTAIFRMELRMGNGLEVMFLYRKIERANMTTRIELRHSTEDPH